MLRVILFVSVMVITVSARVDAQACAVPVDAGHEEPALDVLFAVGAAEWMLTAGPGLGVSIFHSERGHRYLLPSISWGRVLSKPLGPAGLRGRFEWAVEVIPIFGQFSPVDTWGVGVTPLLWRWNFEPRGNIAPFAELAGGALWTSEPVPARTTTSNFTAHAAYGIRYFLRPRQAFVASYRFHHISNGNRLERNPGVNAHVLQFGFTLMMPR